MRNVVDTSPKCRPRPPSVASLSDSSPVWYGCSAVVSLRSTTFFSFGLVGGDDSVAEMGRWSASGRDFCRQLRLGQPIVKFDYMICEILFVALITVKMRQGKRQAGRQEAFYSGTRHIAPAHCVIPRSAVVCAVWVSRRSRHADQCSSAVAHCGVTAQSQVPASRIAAGFRPVRPGDWETGVSHE